MGLHFFFLYFFEKNYIETNTIFFVGFTLGSFAEIYRALKVLFIVENLVSSLTM